MTAPLLRTLAASLLLGALGAVGLGGAAAAVHGVHAVQSAPGFKVSRDLERWEESLDRAPFLPAMAWVPGETRTSTVYVRNTGEEVTDLDLQLRRDPVPSTDAYVSMWAAAPGEAPLDLGAAEQQVLRVADVEPGATVPVVLAASLSDRAPGGSEIDGAVLELQAAPGTEPALPGPWAAANLQLAPLFLGLALAVAAVVRWHRRTPRRPA